MAKNSEINVNSESLENLMSEINSGIDDQMRYLKNSYRKLKSKITQMEEDEISNEEDLGYDVGLIQYERSISDVMSNMSKASKNKIELSKVLSSTIIRMKEIDSGINGEGDKGILAKSEMDAINKLIKNNQ